MGVRGVGVAGSLLRLIQHPTEPIQFTTARLFGTLGVELCLAIGFLPFLRALAHAIQDFVGLAFLKPL